MILQPLVENAIKYGVSRSTRPVTIRISAECEKGHLVLRVCDDGEALPKIDQHAHGNSGGIGLANVRDRLEARYGNAARLVAAPSPSGGYEARIDIPIEATEFNA